MSKSNVRYKNLRIAMDAIQKERSQEVGGHTWKSMVERYGESFLWVEIASITGRLEKTLWTNAFNPYQNINDIDVDRLLDLCIDLGNYTDFLYQSIIDWEKKNNLGKTDDDGRTQVDSGYGE